ncbi:endonuclease/exonuclease/phosphatase family protein (plasmid) [Rhizobium ruizarguesonis]|uniref:Endonuclease/exonuclease/phosphatase family protein n=1 Tax=Rhizobium ruizarguesonis TaxID=2081791 RepID=A0ACD5EI02_9HYPH
MKLATYNVNGVNGRLEVLLRWLDEARPDVVCLQELKATQKSLRSKRSTQPPAMTLFGGPESWNAVAIRALGQEPHLTRKGLSGEPEDERSRYIETWS